MVNTAVQKNKCITLGLHLRQLSLLLINITKLLPCLMINWNVYRPGSKLQVKEKLSQEIIGTFVKDLPEFFAFDKQFRRPKRTRWIKDKLAILGDSKGYKIYANGLSPELKPLKGGSFKNAEWLYDLHWYTEGRQYYTTTTLPLVMECEWQSERKGDPKKPFSGIK